MQDEGIALTSYAPGSYKTRCPKCSHARKKKRDPCLSVTIEADDSAVWHCHNSGCGYTGGTRARVTDYSHRRRQEKKQRRKPTFTPRPANEKMLDWFESRGIERRVVERHRIGPAKHWIPARQKECPCIAFPYYRNGEVVNVKYRTLGKDFAQEKDAEKIFYGLDDIRSDTTVIIVEGELDKLSLEMAGFTNVISVPDGAPALLRDDVPDPDADLKFSYLWNCKDDLDHVAKFILAVDGDEAGRVLEEELARRLGKEMCWRVKWPEGNDFTLKDANEVLLEEGVDVLREVVEAAEPYPISSLWTADSFLEDTLKLYRDGPERAHSTGWKPLDEHYMVREGELTVVTGTPGAGKSEFVDAICMNLAQELGWNFALCSFENPADEHIGKLAEKRTGMPFGDGPTMRMSERDLRGAVEWIGDHFVFIRADNDDANLTIDWILETAAAAVLRYGIRGLVIDPYNEIEHNKLNGQTETDYISKILTKVKRFARSRGVHVWFVAHPAKLQRNKDGNYPKPTLYDISGSAHWFNKADVGIVIHREFDAVRDKEVEIGVRKVRFKAVGRPGEVTLEYDRVTGRYAEKAPAPAQRPFNETDRDVL